GPGMSLGETNCLAVILVFRDDWRRIAPVEVVVHRCADNVPTEPRRGLCQRIGAHDGGNGVNGDQRTRGGYAAEVVVEIFNLDAPVGMEHPFDTAASRPANAGTGNLTPARAKKTIRGCRLEDVV